MGTGEQAYHEQVWSVALALATIKGMVLVDPMIGLSRHVKDLASPHPHVLKLVALVAGGRTGSGLCVVANGLCDTAAQQRSHRHRSWRLHRERSERRAEMRAGARVPCAKCLYKILPF